MSDLIARAESARRRLRLRQRQIASDLGVSQGHYSKVANGQTPLARDLSERIAAWLAANDPDGPNDQDRVADRIAVLVASIQRQCAELATLSAQTVIRNSR